MAIARGHAVATARRINFDPTVAGIFWFVAAAALFAIGMYGVAEILASYWYFQDQAILHYDPKDESTWKKAADAYRKGLAKM